VKNHHLLLTVTMIFQLQRSFDSFWLMKHLVGPVRWQMQCISFVLPTNSWHDCCRRDSPLALPWKFYWPKINKWPTHYTI